MIKTKQELFATIALTLGTVQDRIQAQAQIEALIDDFLADIVQGVCDAVVRAAEEDIRSHSGRS